MQAWITNQPAIEETVLIKHTCLNIVTQFC